MRTPRAQERSQWTHDGVFPCHGDLESDGKAGFRHPEGAAVPAPRRMIGIEALSSSAKHVRSVFRGRLPSKGRCRSSAGMRAEAARRNGWRGFYAVAGLAHLAYLQPGERVAYVG